MRAFGIEPPTWESWAEVALKEAREGFEAPFRVTPPYGKTDCEVFDDPAAALEHVRLMLQRGGDFFVLWGTREEDGGLHQIACIRWSSGDQYVIEEETDTVFGTTVHSLFSFYDPATAADNLRLMALDGMEHRRVRFYTITSAFDRKRFLGQPDPAGAQE